MLFIRATILTSKSPSLSTRSQSVDISLLSFWPGFVTSFNRLTEELTYILYSSFNGLLIQTRRGRGNWSYLSPLSGRLRDKSFSVATFWNISGIIYAKSMCLSVWLYVSLCLCESLCVYDVCWQEETRFLQNQLIVLLATYYYHSFLIYYSSAMHLKKILYLAEEFIFLNILLFKLIFEITISW